MRVAGVEQHRREFAEFYAASRDDCLRIVLISAVPPGRASQSQVQAVWEFVPDSAVIRCRATAAW